MLLFIRVDLLIIRQAASLLSTRTTLQAHHANPVNLSTLTLVFRIITTTARSHRQSQLIPTMPPWRSFLLHVLTLFFSQSLSLANVSLTSNIPSNNTTFPSSYLTPVSVHVSEYTVPVKFPHQPTNNSFSTSTSTLVSASIVSTPAMDNYVPSTDWYPPFHHY